MSSILHELELAFLRKHPDEATDHIELMNDDEALEFFETHPLDDVLPVWSRISPFMGVSVLPRLSQPYLKKLFSLLELRKSAALVENLSEDKKEYVFSSVNPSKKRQIESFLTYPEGSAGALMDTNIVYYHPDITVAETIARFKKSKRTGRRVIFISDSDNKLMGFVGIQELLFAEMKDKLQAHMQEVKAFVTELSSREEILDLLDAKRVSEIPVVDLNGLLVGIVRYDVIVSAAQEEASLDIQTMVGVSKDERALSPVWFAVQKRLPWLEINLVTAFMAAAVVGLFESTIAKYTALAVLLPVVAGQSGNTGAQALAVTMRGLALREISISQWPKVVFKEANVGFFNGVAVALTTSLGVFLWSHSWGLALIIGVSMVISMVLAGISGAAVPVVLTRVGLDPAQSSSIILTTITDIAGFFSFLGIASLLSSILD